MVQYLFIQDIIPNRIFEKWMFLDLMGIRNIATKPKQMPKKKDINTISVTRPFSEMAAFAWKRGS